MGHGAATRAARGTALIVAGVLAASLASCESTGPATPAGSSSTPGGRGGATAAADPVSGGPGTVTLAFAGDVHFERQVGRLLDRPDGSLGPMGRVLAGADLAMVNLESALTTRGRPDPKELETPDARYWFRSPPAALDLLARSGVDVVSMANNHGADYGARGLRDSLRLAREGEVAVVGIGRDRARALRPHRVTVRGTRVAVLAADASPREGSSSVWAAGPSTPGVAAARSPRTGPLVAAVRSAARADDVVVVYLHWGREYSACPTSQQRALAAALAEAGADVVVGSHAHVQQGAGMLGDTYVGYGLGNFLWYHGGQSDSGVLRLQVRDGEVVADDWVSAGIPLRGGPPRPRRGAAAADAEAAWQAVRGCTGLARLPEDRAGAAADPDLPAYTASVRQIGPALARRMSSSHRPGCPLPLRDLALLRLSYVGFDGRAHRGELAVRSDLAGEVVGIFRRLHAARWPIRRMRLVDDYGGDDDRSMAADNTSAFNCRPVAGRTGWSDHAFGAAIDLNPVENPFLTGSAVLPPAGREYADVPRGRGRGTPPGVIGRGGVVHRAFTRRGWAWGGDWANPDFQHFSAR